MKSFDSFENFVKWAEEKGATSTRDSSCRYRGNPFARKHYYRAQFPENNKFNKKKCLLTYLVEEDKIEID